MDITASYLVAGADDGRHPTHYGPELSRRARGFVVWAVLQGLGKKGVRDMVAHHCHCAQFLEQRLSKVEGINILNHVVLNQLAISFGDDDSISVRDALTAKVIARIRAENKNFVLGASWKDQHILRVSIISQLTEIADMEVLATSIIKAWKAVRALA